MELAGPSAFLRGSVSLTVGVGLPLAWAGLEELRSGLVLSPPIPGSVLLQLLVQVQGTLTRRHQFSSETPHAWKSFLKEGESPITQPSNVAAPNCCLTWPTNQTSLHF